MRYFVLVGCFVQLFSTAANASDSLQYYVQQFNTLYVQIRDGSIAPDSAKAQFQAVMAEIRRLYPDSLKGDSTLRLIFPLRGHNARHIGGKQGSGYVLGAYKFFDGVNSTGHPAHDIFILDRNQDGLDDNTWRAVDVLSVCTGLVVACEHEWATDSPLRGGKYIWIYNFERQALFYYAHNRRLMVQAGDIVLRGQKIAEVGRTGRNAFKARSPTHLHFGQMRLVANLPVPYNSYASLVNAVVKY